jgi:peptidoglycan/LPS O-acetylase OafA/YrhL
VGLLIALAIERFTPRLPHSVEARRLTVAGRTMPASFGLLIALIGTTAVPSQAIARGIAALAFVLTALGVLSVIYSALDRAEHPEEHVICVAAAATTHAGQHQLGGEC